MLFRSSQAGSASHTSVPSVSGAGDQEVDSHPGPSRVARVPATVKAFAQEMKEEILLKLSDSLVAPLRNDCDTGFQQQGERIQRLEDRVGQVESQLATVDAKLDLILQHLQIPQPQGNLPPPPPPNPPLLLHLINPYFLLLLPQLSTTTATSSSD